MAKITDQTIPPELALAASRVITTNINILGVAKTASARKGARKSTKKQKPPKGLNDFTEAATYIAKKMYPNKSDEDNAVLIRSIVRDLKAGIFDENWWYKCDLMSTEYIRSNPTYEPDRNPPPYNYRVSWLLPSIPTYPDGVSGYDGMEYNGSQHGNLFCDDNLTWARFVYQLNKSETPNSKIYAFAVIGGYMTVAASDRGSKPMLSVISAGALTPKNDPALGTLESITKGVAVSAPTMTRAAQSHYWRYKLPKTNPPYFNEVRLRPIVRSLVKMCSVQNSNLILRAMILLAPRPMFGRGYNNNDHVHTELAAVPILYAILPAFDYKAIKSYGRIQAPWPTPWSSTGNDLTINGKSGYDLSYSGDLSLYHQRCDIAGQGRRIPVVDYRVDTNQSDIYLTRGWCVDFKITFIAKVEGKKYGTWKYTKRSWNFNYDWHTPMWMCDLVDVTITTEGKTTEENHRSELRPAFEMVWISSGWTMNTYND